ncbi:MAG: hypothetical protein ACRDY3_13060, partial [Acidimicrobiales bacterium]
MGPGSAESAGDPVVTGTGEYPVQVSEKGRGGLSRSGRIAIVLGLLAAVTFMVVWSAMTFVGTEPPSVSYSTGHHSGQPVHLVLQTDGAVGTGAHPTWVSYQVKSPATGQWVHTTLWELPPNTKINVTIYQFDSGSPLRNQHWGRVTGVDGGSITLNGTTTVKVIDSNKVNVGHTFTVPALGINVPLLGVDTSKKTFCTAGPCNPATQLNNKVQFSFTTPGTGVFHW